MAKARRLLVMLFLVIPALAGSAPAATADDAPLPAGVANLPNCLHPTTQATLPAASVAADVAAIEALAGPRLEAIGACPNGAVTVNLMPGSEALAKRLSTRYGPALMMTVGLSPWKGRPSRSGRCRPLPAWTSTPQGLALSLHLDAPTVRSGLNVDGSLVVRDIDLPTFEMDTGQPLTAVVVRRGTHHVVGVYTGGIAGTGYGPRIGPGQSYRVRVVTGTARCDGGIGSALPPGRYQVVVLVMNETGVPPRFLTPPVDLTVTR